MKYVLITGVSSGIGNAIAKKFITEGCYVFGSVRKQEDADRLKQEFNSSNFHPLLFDITDREAVQEAVKNIEDIVGKEGLSCLVNNAGVSYYGPMEHFPIDDLRKQFEINVFATVDLTQQFLPLLGTKDLESPSGKIIVISSAAGVWTRPFLGPYSGSKHALEAIFDAYRRELKLYGIDVVIIQPGPIRTEIWDKAQMFDIEKYKGTHYEELLQKIETTAIEQIKKLAIPPSRVADKVFLAFEKKKPKARYLVTPMKLAFKIFMYVLPARWLDAYFMNELKKIQGKQYQIKN
ncbi:dehydrogenase/reductase SDR family member 7B [Flavobacteriaceae bacterium UJ101]|nr:dehydrogenase/reductase SDR family member 7B [Flavobacteriaceae bacterium UJ101]